MFITLKPTMDHREHARLAAIISRRRQQIARLEEQLTEVRKKLKEDEEELESLKTAKLAVSADVSCSDAAKSLRRCAAAKRRREKVEGCADAGKALSQCKK